MYAQAIGTLSLDWAKERADPVTPPAARRRAWSIGGR